MARFHRVPQRRPVPTIDCLQRRAVVQKQAEHPCCGPFLRLEEHATFGGTDSARRPVERRALPLLLAKGFSWISTTLQQKLGDVNVAACDRNVQCRDPVAGNAVDRCSLIEKEADQAHASVASRQMDRAAPRGLQLRFSDFFKRVSLRTGTLAAAAAAGDRRHFAVHQRVHALAVAAVEQETDDLFVTKSDRCV
eukprot:scaffold11_cov257-Pinguiococcus_pyrenoidosus.AAC.30